MAGSEPGWDGRRLTNLARLAGSLAAGGSLPLAALAGALAQHSAALRNPSTMAPKLLLLLRVLCREWLAGCRGEEALAAGCEKVGKASAAASAAAASAAEPSADAAATGVFARDLAAFLRAGVGPWLVAKESEGSLERSELDVLLRRVELAQRWLKAAAK